jgi:eukaryotic-like serine/threonine-protein kinase
LEALWRKHVARYNDLVEFSYVDEDKEQAQARIGQVIGHGYRLTRLLGTGGMAAVFAAQSPTGQEVALKVLHDHMHRRLDIRRRFLREGETANRIAHPGIVKIIEHSKEGDREAFLVMELLQGQSLLSAIRGGAIGTSGVLDVLDQVLDALSIAHALGIVHRDLKPDNLWLTPEGRVKVLDFGIARVLDGVPKDQRTKTGITLGTVPFMSPEQAVGKPEGVDARTDVFALGALAFRILAGRPVHEADTDAGLLVAMATQPAPPLCRVAPEVPKEIGAVVDRALAFYKEDRYPDARTMQADVRALRAGRAPSTLAVSAGGATMEAKTSAEGERPFVSQLVTAVTPAPDAPTRVDAAATAALTEAVSAEPHSARTVLARGPDAATVVTGPAAGSAIPLGVNPAATAMTTEGKSPERRWNKVWIVASLSLVAGVGLTLAFALARSDERPAAEPAPARSVLTEAAASESTSDVAAPKVSSQPAQKAAGSRGVSAKQGAPTPAATAAAAPATTAPLATTAAPTAAAAPIDTRTKAPAAALTGAPPSPAGAPPAADATITARGQKNKKDRDKGKPPRH